MKDIICFHLLNDYSGSPQVLKSVLQGLMKRGYKVTLYTSDGGALDELIGETHFTKVTCSYNFSKHKLITLLRAIRAELIMGFYAARYCGRSNVLFYINTLLPFVPATVGRLIGKRVIYHCHENAYVKGLHYRILNRWMEWTASEIICVSDTQKSHLHRSRGVRLAYNALSKPHPVETSGEDIHSAFHRKKVLMVCSLKRYKGILEFLRLATNMLDYDFVLVISDSMENIQSFLKKTAAEVPSNLQIYPKQRALSEFYQDASVCLNLSNKRLFVESFGMTIIEAMSFGVPVIIPTEGGLSNFVIDGWNGYKIDVESLPKIEQQLKAILSDWELYQKLSMNALHTARLFSPERQLDEILKAINS